MAGRQQNLILYGANLQEMTDQSWDPIPGLHFSNTAVLNPGVVSFRVRADANALPSGEQLTNIAITTPTGQKSNPYALVVFR